MRKGLEFLALLSVFLALPLTSHSMSYECQYAMENPNANWAMTNCYLQMKYDIFGGGWGDGGFNPGDGDGISG